MKSKPVRTKYDDTGIDLEHWHRYRMLSEIHQMRALLVFIDEDLAKVYGNFLDVLDVVRPHRGKSGHINYYYPRPENYGRMIIYFPMSAMIPFGELTPDQCAALRGLSTRDPKYAALAEQRMRQGKLL